jgi:hypothetical protein
MPAGTTRDGAVPGDVPSCGQGDAW